MQQTNGIEIVYYNSYGRPSKRKGCFFRLFGLLLHVRKPCGCEIVAKQKYLMGEGKRRGDATSSNIH